MAKNIIQKKEKQDVLIRCFAFLVIFILLNSFTPLSLDFSPPVKTIEEKPNYFHIIKFLEEFNFDDFTAFNLIPEFQGSIGRNNPFQLSFDQITFQENDLDNNVDNERRERESIINEGTEEPLDEIEANEEN